MDTAEARAVAAVRLGELRIVPFAELKARFLDPERQETGDVVAPSGARYQVEALAVQEGENLRVMVSVDDGGWRSFAPVSDDFIVTPDGTFVGE